MTRLRVLAALAALLMLAACAGAPRPDEDSQIVRLLDSYRQLADQPPEEQWRAYQEAQSAYDREPGDLHRLQLALILSLPRAPWRNDARVLQLIETLAEEPADTATLQHGVATLLHKLVSERLRLLREEERKANSLLARQQRQLQDERQRSDELQHKLDALLTIDRATRRRPAPP